MSSVVAERVGDLGGSFDRVYRKHVRDVYRFSASLLGNAHDAEDATQTTFLHAYRALERGERVANVRGWLLAIARNVCRQHFRSSASRAQPIELNGDGPAVAAAEGPSATEIRDALRHLPFNQRLALVLREIEGLKYEEIAETMGLSVGAVETLLFRARQALREQLEAAERDPGCDGIQRLISLQLDGRLSRSDRGLLRAHLRTCGECARAARSQRSRKRLMPGLAGPLPAALSRGFEIGGGVLSSKAAAVAAAAALAGVGVVVVPAVVPDQAARASQARPAAGSAMPAASVAARPARPSSLAGTAARRREPALERAAVGGATSAAVGSRDRPAASAGDRHGPRAGGTGGTRPGAGAPGGAAPASIPGAPAGSSGLPQSAAPPAPPPRTAPQPDPPAVSTPPAASAPPVQPAPPPPPPLSASPPPPPRHGPPAGTPVGPPSTPVGPPVSPPRGSPGPKPVGPPTVPVGPPVTPPKP